MKEKRIIEAITRRGMCSSCGLCAELFGKDKVDFKVNEDGYYRPIFNNKLEKSEVEDLVELCPGINMISSEIERIQAIPEGKNDECYVGWSLDEEVRWHASSGGALTAILVAMVKSGFVDGVIHASRKTNVLSGEAVISRTAEEIKENVGSLYMPIPMLKNIKEHLNSEGTYAFVGKGCEIRALRKYLKKIGKENKIKICLGIMCGGNPSIKSTYKLLEDNDLDTSKVTSLKYRGDGWPGFFIAKTSEGKTLRMSYNDTWARYLGPTAPMACKLCFDGIAEEADITFGDAWYCDDNNYPDFSERDGRNLIICRSNIGRMALMLARNNKHLLLEKVEVPSEEFMRMQPSQTNRRQLAKYKIQGVRLMGMKYPLVNKDYLNKLSRIRITDSVTKMRTILGTMKRFSQSK